MRRDTHSPQRRKHLCLLLWRLALAIMLLMPAAAQAVCVCGTGRMTNWFPGTAPITIDGNMGDWTGIMTNPNNNICDGYPASIIPEYDGQIQSTGRDLMQFTYTYDTNYVYAYTQRYASESNTDNFIYYADTNNDGFMQTGEPVVVVSWQGSNRTVGVYLGTYKAYYATGDPMVCTPGYTAGQSCTTAYADGYHLPGVIMNLPAGGHPNYTGAWGSLTGTEMEWRVSWADLGMASNPGTPFTFHVSSTNSQPGAGSFPAQVDDNMGGCGGKGGTTQYAGVTLSTPNTSIALDASGYPRSYTVNQTLTNTGNGNDNFLIKITATSSNNNLGGFPTSVSLIYNGQSYLVPLTNGVGTLDTSVFGSGFKMAAGQSISFQEVFTFPAFPGNNKNFSVLTSATSDFDSTATPGTDTVTMSTQTMVTVSNQATAFFPLPAGTNFYFTGTNGVPATAFALNPSAGSNPITSPGYVIANTSQDLSVTETVPSGWVFDHAACNYPNNPAGTVSFTVSQGSGTVTATVLKASYAGGNVNCTFYNKMLPTIRAMKELPAPVANSGDKFTISLKSGATVVQSCDATGTGTSVSYQATPSYSCPGPISYTPASVGASYTINEPSSAAYAASLSCNNNGTPAAVPSAFGQSFTPTWGDNYVCYVINTTLPVLTVANRTFAGYGTFNFSAANGSNTFPFALSTSAASNPATTQAYILPALNTDTTVSENLSSPPFPAGWVLSQSSCVDAASSAVASSGAGQSTVTIPASAVVAGAKFTCTFDNTYRPNLQITKTADKASATPGTVITYTVRMTNTAGAASGVELTDDLSPYGALVVDYSAGAPFQFVDGATPSGLTLGAPLYSRDHGATWTSAIPASGSDATITNWKIPMVGAMNGFSTGTSPYPSFSVKYQVVVR